MRYIANLVFLFLIVAAFYIFTRPLEDISIKDLPTYSAPVEISPEPVSQQSTISFIPEATVEREAEIEYYIILESLRNLALAQQRTEKLKNDLNANVIVLPPTKEGYFRISYGKYTSIEEARSASKSLKTTISRDIWILSVKNSE